MQKADENKPLDASCDYTLGLVVGRRVFQQENLNLVEPCSVGALARRFLGHF